MGNKYSLFAVLRLNKFMFRGTDGTELDVDLQESGLVGYIPVYNNKKDAEAATENGRFAIAGVNNQIEGDDYEDTGVHEE